MANSSICSVQDCGKQVKARGWCSKHHTRWLRNGSPTAIRDPWDHEDPHVFFRDIVMNYDGDECLDWPYASGSNGYGLIRRQGSMRSVSRIVCENVNGPPPTTSHQAAHSCGRGSHGCVTKRHLSWKTRRENEADKIGHGTAPRGEKNHFSKLRREDVDAIIALKGTALQREIAAMFGVTQSHVSRIHKLQIWIE